MIPEARVPEAAGLPGLFLHALSVPEAAIDGNGHANNLEYLRWIQDAATAHSDAVGWTLARYREARSTWVIRSHQVDYLRPAFAGEALVVATWVGGFAAQTSPRHCLVWRPGDAKVLVRATTLWVHVDAATGRAAAIPEPLRAAFPVLTDESAVLQALRTGHFTA